MNPSNDNSKQPALALPPTHVVVRLVDGGSVLAGTYGSAAEANRGAAALLQQFAQANGAWPLVGARYVRPEAVVSIDVVEEEHRRWGGSAERAKIMEAAGSAR